MWVHTHALEPVCGMWAIAYIHKAEGPLDILHYHPLLTLLKQDLSLDLELLIQTVNLDANNSQQSPISALTRAGITGTTNLFCGCHHLYSDPHIYRARILEPSL